MQNISLNSFELKTKLMFQTQNFSYDKAFTFKLKINQ